MRVSDVMMGQKGNGSARRRCRWPKTSFSCDDGGGRDAVGIDIWRAAVVVLWEAGLGKR